AVDRPQAAGHRNFSHFRTLVGLCRIHFGSQVPPRSSERGCGCPVPPSRTSGRRRGRGRNAHGRPN
ncbi:MAG: hypothetical protein ACK56F_16875, partial [bacterium]